MQSNPQATYDRQLLAAEQKRQIRIHTGTSNGHADFKEGHRVAVLTGATHALQSQRHDAAGTEHRRACVPVVLIHDVEQFVDGLVLPNFFQPARRVVHVCDERLEHVSCLNERQVAIRIDIEPARDHHGCGECVYDGTRPWAVTPRHVPLEHGP